MTDEQAGERVPEKAADEPEAWLARRATIRGLWLAFAAVLVLVLLTQLAVGAEGHFGIDGSFGFAACCGFGAAVALVVVAKLLGLVLKRPDTYYDD